MAYIISVKVIDNTNHIQQFYICDDSQEWITDNLEWAKRYYSLTSAEREIQNNIGAIKYDLKRFNCTLFKLVIKKQIIKYKDVKIINI